MCFFVTVNSLSPTDYKSQSKSKKHTLNKYTCIHVCKGERERKKSQLRVLRSSCSFSFFPFPTSYEKAVRVFEKGAEGDKKSTSITTQNIYSTF